MEVHGVRPERLLTVQEIARRLAVTPETVRRWLRAGRLKGFILGSDKAGWRVKERELAAFLSQMERASQESDLKEDD
jgi:excisionase family DNA binding protein